MHRTLSIILICIIMIISLASALPTQYNPWTGKLDYFGLEPNIRNFSVINETFVPYTGAIDNVDLDTYKIFAGTNSTIGDSNQYMELREETIGVYGNYPIIKFYSNGLFGNVGGFPENLVIWDEDDSKFSQFTFSSNDGATLGQILYDFTNKKFTIQSGIDVSDQQFDIDGNATVRRKLTVGEGTAGVDYKIYYDGATKDGYLEWYDTDSQFKFSDDLWFNTGLNVIFNNAAAYITGSGTELNMSGNGINLNGNTDLNYHNLTGFNTISTDGATATGLESVALSKLAQATGQYSVALGERAEATGQGAVAIGERTVASGGDAFALGSNSQSQGSDSVAIGYYAQADAFSDSFAIGAGTYAGGEGTMALGYYTQANENFSTAIGYNTECDKIGATCISENVSIGGNNPTEELEVIGDVNITDDLILGDDLDAGGHGFFNGELRPGSGYNLVLNASAISGQIEFEVDGSKEWAIEGYTNNINFRNNDLNKVLFYFTDDGDEGRLGINNGVNADYNLDVNGSANIDGDLFVNGNNITGDYVPYTGANKNVNLGAHNITLSETYLPTGSRGMQQPLSIGVGNGYFDPFYLTDDVGFGADVSGRFDIATLSFGINVGGTQVGYFDTSGNIYGAGDGVIAGGDLTIGSNTNTEGDVIILALTNESDGTLQFLGHEDYWYQTDDWFFNNAFKWFFRSRNQSIYSPSEGTLLLNSTLIEITEDMDINGGLDVTENVTADYFIGTNFNCSGTICKVGEEAGDGNTGTYVTAFGHNSGDDNTGDFGIFNGVYAGRENTGDYIVAIGYYALDKAKGNLNTGVGHTALQGINGAGNSGFGASAGDGVEGEYNSFFGFSPGENFNGSYNNFIGYYSGYLSSMAEGSYNNFIGSQAGYRSPVTGTTAIGTWAGYDNIGNYSIFIGDRAGKDNTLNNIFILKQNSIETTPLISGSFGTGNLGFKIDSVSDINATIHIGPGERRFPVPSLLVSGDMRPAGDSGTTWGDYSGIELSNQDSSAGIGYEFDDLILYVNNTDTTSEIIGITIEGDGDVIVETNLTSDNYFSGDGSQGITDTSSYWLCDAADCSSTCQVSIKDGLITACT